MNIDVIVAIIVATLGSTGLFSLIQYLIGRKDRINDRLDTIEKQMKRSEIDSCRTQLLVMMSDYPEERSQIMKLAQHYFVDLKGDWYFTGIFNNWLDEKEIPKPVWFREGD